MRIYLDHNLVSFLAKYDQWGKLKNQDIQKEVDSLITLLKKEDVVVSEECLAEIMRLPNPESTTKKLLEKKYFSLKNDKGVIRNSIVAYDDPTIRYDSTDILYNHLYDDSVLNQVKDYLQKKGNYDNFDARYIANAMLKENNIDFFLTYDKKTIWNHRVEIGKLFNVKVKLPSELQKELGY